MNPAPKALALSCQKAQDFQADTAINENTNMLYVIMHPFQNNSLIKVVDCTKNDKFEESISEKGANKLAIDPKTNLIYVANTGSNSVSVIQDDASNKFLVFLKKLFNIPTNLHILNKSIPVGNQPNGIAVNPTTNKVYVTNTGSNTYPL